MSFLPLCISAADAVASYRRHGACLVRLEFTESWGFALDELQRWCCEAGDYVERNPHWLSKLSRAEGCDSPSSRHSLNHWSNSNYPEWQAMLKEMQCHSSVVSDLLLSLAVDTGYSSFKHGLCGGDLVRPHGITGQKVHSDGGRPCSEHELRNTPWMAMSIAVYDIGLTNAPLSFWGIDSMRGHYDKAVPSARAEVGLNFEETLVCMSRGDILVRNPLVWHCGTGNQGGLTRYLPAIQWEAFDDVHDA